MTDVMQLFGAFLLGHDLEDFPDVSRIHHWQIGAGLLLLPEIKKLLEEEDEE